MEITIKMTTNQNTELFPLDASINQSKCRAVEPVSIGYIYKPIKMQICGAHFHWIHVYNCPGPQAQGTWQKVGQKDCKSHSTRVCCETVSPSNFRSYACTFYQHGCQMWAVWTRMTPMSMLEWTVKSPWSLSLTTKYRQLRNSGSERGGLWEGRVWENMRGYMTGRIWEG